MDLSELIVNLLALIGAALPLVMSLASKKVSGSSKLIWFLVSLFFSWVGYLIYYFAVVKSINSEEPDFITNTDSPHNKLHFMASVPAAIVIAIIYMSFVYKSWDKFDEFLRLSPAFLITGISVGLFISLMPLRRPLLFAFSVSIFAPVLCGLTSAAIKGFINIAQASEGNLNLPSNSELFWLFFLSLGIVFGLISMFGCYLGIIWQKTITRYYLSITNESDGIKHPELYAAKVGAYSTLAAAILSSLVSLMVGYIGKG